MASTPPPHVAAALAGERADFAVPLKPTFGMPPRTLFVLAGAWAAGTAKGLAIVTPRDVRFEPWGAYGDAALQGDAVHLAARPGLRSPFGRRLAGGDDPERVRSACLARIRGAEPGP